MIASRGDPRVWAIIVALIVMWWLIVRDIVSPRPPREGKPSCPGAMRKWMKRLDRIFGRRCAGDPKGGAAARRSGGGEPERDLRPWKKDKRSRRGQ